MEQYKQHAAGLIHAIIVFGVSVPMTEVVIMLRQRNCLGNQHHQHVLNLCVVQI